MILYIAFLAMDKDIISPAFLFTAPFCVAVIFAALYRKKWDLNIHLNTMLVLLLGCFLFVLTCFIVHYTVGKNIRKRIRNGMIESVYESSNTVVPIKIEAWKIVLFIVIQLISVYIVSMDMRRVVGKYGISGDFTNIMYYFREYHMHSDYDVALSSIASNLRLFSIAGCYIWIYVLLNNFLCKKHKSNSILLIVSIVLGVINSIVLGARGEAIQLFVAVVVLYFFLQKKYNHWKAKVNFKQIFLITIMIGSIIFAFKFSGELLGRNTSTISAVDEVAKYFGAEIKNLDIYLEGHVKGTQISGSQTFGVILGWIDNKLGLDWNIETVLPFNKVNGISLGNVYTIFYPLIYDFGYLGIFILIPIIACFSQLLYEYALLEKSNKLINLRIIVNSYVLFLVVFSFFGERFFSYILNISFIKYILIWSIMIWFNTKLRVKIKA